MRLKSIKLAGFKSFVDPTTVSLPTNLTAIVGPNGCGKSNIIDAVRWVMGESSAKQLRGESLDDVIFNGSVSRKPLSHAAIELQFDNSDGTLTGPYASYNEISIRREITREGQSSYYLNNTRCRRRDITDLFLGTGLGPRSYAIIEQGMISRLIEAKPEDLRAYIEEVAGISKYKERKHETELRIHHTEENLARLNDIREELSKQLNHLQRQANAAERYKVLKQEERLLKVQVLGIRWRSLEQHVVSQRNYIQEQESELSSFITLQQQVEQSLEELRQQQTQVSTANNEIQKRYYEANTETNRYEQTLQNLQQRREQWQQEYGSLTQQQQEVAEQLITLEEQLLQLQQEIKTSTPNYEEAKSVVGISQQVLINSEQELQQWQINWDHFQQQVAQTSRIIEVEQTRVQHLQQRIQLNQQRNERLTNEQHQQELALGDVPVDDFEQEVCQLQKQHEEVTQQLQEISQAITVQREQNQHGSQDLDAIKNHLQTLRGQQTSLEALQQVALGQREEIVVDWLKQQGLVESPRLAQLLQVEPGWEIAVETVLERYLQAVCVDDINFLTNQLDQLPKANLSLVVKNLSQQSASANSRDKSILLSSKVNSSLPLMNLLTGIYIAETFTSATEMLPALAEHESIITRTGIWIGKGWLWVAHKADAKTGVLQRERELSELRITLEQANVKLQQSQQALTEGQQRLELLQEQRENLQQQATQLVATQADARSKQQVKQAHLAQIEKRSQQIKSEVNDCERQIQDDVAALSLAQNAVENAKEQIQQQEQQKELLLNTKNTCQMALEAARQQAQKDRETCHQLELHIQATQLQLSNTEQTNVRLKQEQHERQNREMFLQKSLQESNGSIEELTQQLQVATSEKTSLNEQVNLSQQQTAAIEQELQSLEQQRHRREQDILKQRDVLEQGRLAAQANEVRAKSIEEQIVESGYELTSLLTELTEDLLEPTLEENLTQVQRKIERLGAINLAAIDEHTQQMERKEYLDKQYSDLTEALTILQDAMKKMDGETRTRFKETYEKINENFQRLFPTLFAGGRASLQMDQEDSLVAGISVMAQPPGKRNSTIHLLSGGEKALTAIALVFALFQLNPAPFCMLDEVDAPLDDANVGRFCNLVKQLSSEVQFIFISHNKLAIEMAEQLAGVTMHEAGVSRLVAVDIEEAIAMATA